MASITKAIPREIGTGFDDDDDVVGKPRQKKDNKAGKKKQEDGAPMSLDVACHDGELSQVVLLWAQGLSMSQPDPQGYPPLMWACLKNQAAVARFLLDNGASPDDGAPDGQTPLMWAATESAYECGKLLIASGANPNLTDAHGYTAACIAVQNGNLTFLHMLHCLNAVDANQLDFDGHHLTTWACYKGEIHVLEYLHQVLKVPLNGVDKTRRSALHWAAREGHTECAIYLMANGVSTIHTDQDGKTPLQYATERHHVECAAAIRANQTNQQNHLVGSLQLLTSTKTHLLNSCCSIIYFIIHYVWSCWMIPIWAHVPTGGFFAKNMAFTFFRHTPVRNSVPESSLLQDIGAPKSLMGALRGPAMLRRREVANLFAVCSLFTVQYLAATLNGVPVPVIWYVAAVVGLVAAAICKLTSFANVIENGKMLDDPSLAVIERGEYRKVHPRVYDQIRHVRIPLRAFYCVEIDRNVKRYDSYSVLLDCPVAANNHRSFVVVLFCIFVMELTLLVNAFSFLSNKHCAPDQPFSFVRFIWNMVFSNLPCAVKLQSDSWEEWLLPKPDNVAGCWLITYTIPITLWTFTCLLRQLVAVCNGVTRAEILDPTAVNVNGEMESIIRGGSYIFSDSGKLGNLLLWIMGKAGERWEGMQAIPAKPAA